MQINNLPNDWAKYTYIVVRESYNQYWYWGGYNTYERAYKAAIAVDGIVLNDFECINDL
ncbi:MAG: hypothetical protein MJZ20_08445 [Bacteroidaceae bacterium]|nr:hypothetical protein [Bacteroidaceae bacterium]